MWYKTSHLLLRQVQESRQSRKISRQLKTNHVIKENIPYQTLFPAGMNVNIYSDSTTNLNEGRNNALTKQNTKNIRVNKFPD